MPYYDNPAGRLHELLRLLSAQPNQESLLKAWASVLGVAKRDVVLHIGGVAELVQQIQEAVDRAEDEALRAPVTRLRDTWARPIFPPDQPFNGPLHAVLPGNEPLESLALVSSQLHLLAPEGRVPDSGTLDELKQQVRDLVDEIRQSDELPDDLKHAIASRLMDVGKAVEHVHVGGPGAVRRAMEAVMGTVLFTADPGTTTRVSAMQKLWATLGILWVAFNAGPKIQDSIEAWPKIVHELTSGQVVEAPENPRQPVEPSGVSAVRPRPELDSNQRPSP